MKKYFLIIILLIFLLIILLSFSGCIWWNDNNNDGKFKESINHKLLWKKYTADGSQHLSIQRSYYNDFDGQYFYFAARDSTNDKVYILKYDLDGNLKWQINITELSLDPSQNDIVSVKKLENFLYVISAEFGLPSHKYYLNIVDAEDGKYYGRYLLTEGGAFDSIAPDTDGKTNFVVLSCDYSGYNYHRLTIFSFDKNSKEPKLLTKRIFEKEVVMFSYKCIHNGRMYLNSTHPLNSNYPEENTLIVLDCDKLSNPSYTDDECIIKTKEEQVYAVWSWLAPKVIDNKVISSYFLSGLGYRFICYDESKDYEKIWESPSDMTHKEDISAPEADLTYFNGKVIYSCFNNYVGCFDINDGKLLWFTDNSLYEDPSMDVGRDNHGMGAIMNNKWYVQPVYTNTAIIIYDIASGKKIGRIEDIYTSFGLKNPLWVVGNRIYVASWIGYFYCFEISEKYKVEYFIIPIFLIISFIFYGGYKVRKKKKSKDKNVESKIDEKKVEILDQENISKKYNILEKERLSQNKVNGEKIILKFI